MIPSWRLPFVSLFVLIIILCCLQQQHHSSSSSSSFSSFSSPIYFFVSAAATIERISAVTNFDTTWDYEFRKAFYFDSYGWVLTWVGQMRLLKVDLSSMTVAQTKNGDETLDTYMMAAFTDDVQVDGASTTPRYAYFGQYSPSITTSMIVKYDLKDPTIKRIGSVWALTGKESRFYSGVKINLTHGVFAAETTPGRLVFFDLENMVRTDALVGSTGENRFMTLLYDHKSKDFLYASTRMSPGQVVKFSIKGMNRVASVSGSLNEDAFQLGLISSDGQIGWFAVSSGPPTYLVRFNLKTMSRLTPSLLLSSPAEDKIYTGVRVGDSDLMVASSGASGRTVVHISVSATDGAMTKLGSAMGLANETNMWCSLTDGSFGYFGTATSANDSPGHLVKFGILTTTGASTTTTTLTSTTTTTSSTTTIATTEAPTTAPSTTPTSTITSTVEATTAATSSGETTLASSSPPATSPPSSSSSSVPENTTTAAAATSLVPTTSPITTIAVSSSTTTTATTKAVSVGQNTTTTTTSEMSSTTTTENVTTTAAPAPATTTTTTTIPINTTTPVDPLENYTSPGLDQEAQDNLLAAATTAGIVVGLVTPTAALTTQRSLALFSLAGCPQANGDEKKKWTHASLSFPRSFFPGSSVGSEEGGHARMAVVGFIVFIPILSFVVCIVWAIWKRKHLYFYDDDSEDGEEEDEGNDITPTSTSQRRSSKKGGQGEQEEESQEENESKRQKKKSKKQMRPLSMILNFLFCTSPVPYALLMYSAQTVGFLATNTGLISTIKNGDGVFVDIVLLTALPWLFVVCICYMFLARARKYVIQPFYETEEEKKEKLKEKKKLLLLKMKKEKKKKNNNKKKQQGEKTKNNNKEDEKEQKELELEGEVKSKGENKREGKSETEQELLDKQSKSHSAGEDEREEEDTEDDDDEEEDPVGKLGLVNSRFFVAPGDDSLWWYRCKVRIAEFLSTPHGRYFIAGHYGWRASKTEEEEVLDLLRKKEEEKKKKEEQEENNKAEENEKSSSSSSSTSSYGSVFTFWRGKHYWKILRVQSENYQLRFRSILMKMLGPPVNEDEKEKSEQLSEMSDYRRKYSHYTFPVLCGLAACAAMANGIARADMAENCSGALVVILVANILAAIFSIVTRPFVVPFRNLTNATIDVLIAFSSIIAIAVASSGADSGIALVQVVTSTCVTVGAFLELSLSTIRNLLFFVIGIKICSHSEYKKLKKETAGKIPKEILEERKAAKEKKKKEEREAENNNLVLGDEQELATLLSPKEEEEVEKKTTINLDEVEEVALPTKNKVVLSDSDDDDDDLVPPPPSQLPTINFDDDDDDEDVLQYSPSPTKQQQEQHKNVQFSMPLTPRLQLDVEKAVQKASSLKEDFESVKQNNTPRASSSSSSPQTMTAAQFKQQQEIYLAATISLICQDAERKMRAAASVDL